MILYHHTSLAGLVPFLHGNMELTPQGHSRSDGAQAPSLDWAEADRLAALALTHGAQRSRAAAAALEATAQHTRLREATTLSTLAFSVRERCGSAGELSIGLDARTLSQLPNTILVPRSDGSPEKILETILSRRGWRNDAPPAKAKREAVLAFVSTLLALSPRESGLDWTLAVVSVRLHNDPRLKVMTTAAKDLQPMLVVPLPREAVVEIVLDPLQPKQQTAALALLLRQQRLNHVVLRQARAVEPTSLDGDRARAPTR
ncbi:MAG: hypothetical protein R3B89_12270 [Polyangiaceae bacterium]